MVNGTLYAILASENNHAALRTLQIQRAQYFRLERNFEETSIPHTVRWHQCQILHPF